MDVAPSPKFGMVLDERILHYHLGAAHPMNSKRILPAFTLFHELFTDANPEQFEFVVPQDLGREYLELAHTNNFIAAMDRLSRLGQGRAFEHGLGTADCPVWAGMSEAAEFVVNSSMQTAERIYGGDFPAGFIMLGGLHHARADKAAGFCYYNDINVTIYRLKALQPNIKILYIDTDLHHGDGVQFEFYNDPNVCTISFHESGEYLYPGTGAPHENGSGEGEGFSINFPFFPYTWDATYQQRFDEIIPAVFESYQPDFVIWQAGVDAHNKDILGHLRLSTNTYGHITRRIQSLVNSAMDTPRLLSLGGGGYNPSSVARSWATIIGELTGVKVPKYASDEWITHNKEQGISVEKQLHDKQTRPVEEYAEEVMVGNDKYKAEFDSVFDL